MPAFKETNILDSTILLDGSGTFTGSSFNIPDSWATMISVKLTNLSFPLTVPATAQIEVSNDDVTYYSYDKLIVGFLNPLDVQSIALIVKIPAIYLRVTYVAGDQDVNILTEISELKEKEPSVRQLTKRNRITLTTTTETTLLAAETSFFIDITDLTIVNTSLIDTTTVDFRDSTGGTIRLSINLNPNSTETINLSSLLKQATINNNWTAKLSFATTSVIITALAQLNT